MTAKLQEMVLQHVDPSKLLMERRIPDEKGEIQNPDWYHESTDGGVALQGWYGGTVMVTMETRVSRQVMVAAVAVSGMYATDNQMSAQNMVKDSSTLEKATEADLKQFSRRAVNDLYPFLRAELHALTSRLGGVAGVMAATAPDLDD